MSSSIFKIKIAEGKLIIEATLKNLKFACENKGGTLCEITDIQEFGKHITSSLDEPSNSNETESGLSRLEAMMDTVFDDLAESGEDWYIDKEC